MTKNSDNRHLECFVEQPVDAQTTDRPRVLPLPLPLLLLGLLLFGPTGTRNIVADDRGLVLDVTMRVLSEQRTERRLKLEWGDSTLLYADRTAGDELDVRYIGLSSDHFTAGPLRSVGLDAVVAAADTRSLLSDSQFAGGAYRLDTTPSRSAHRGMVARADGFEAVVLRREEAWTRHGVSWTSDFARRHGHVRILAVRTALGELDNESAWRADPTTVAAAVIRHIGIEALGENFVARAVFPIGHAVRPAIRFEAVGRYASRLVRLNGGVRLYSYRYVDASGGYASSSRTIAGGAEFVPWDLFTPYLRLSVDVQQRPPVPALFIPKTNVTDVGFRTRHGAFDIRGAWTRELGIDSAGEPAVNDDLHVSGQIDGKIAGDAVRLGAAVDAGPRRAVVRSTVRWWGDSAHAELAFRYTAESNPLATEESPCAPRCLFRYGETRRVRARVRAGATFDGLDLAVSATVGGDDGIEVDSLARAADAPSRYTEVSFDARLVYPFPTPR